MAAINISQSSVDLNKLKAFFTDVSHNIRIELLGIASCKLTIIDNNLKQLDGVNRLLNAYVREAPLDGGSPAQFEHNLCLEEKHLTITGNMIDAINALHALNRLSDSLRNDIVEQIALDTYKQVLNIIPVDKQNIFVSKMQAAGGDLSSYQHSPTMSLGKVH